MNMLKRFQKILENFPKFVQFDPLSANPTNGQTHSNNSSAFVCLTILQGWCLKGELGVLTKPTQKSLMWGLIHDQKRCILPTKSVI